MTKKEQKIIGIFEKMGVIKEGHFVYASGRHGRHYIEKRAIYPHQELNQLCELAVININNLNSELFHKIQAVVSPAEGGIALCQVVAQRLRFYLGNKILAVYANKAERGDGFIFKWGYDKLIKDKYVILFDDILTTGGSLKKLKKTVEDIGGKILCAGVLWNRGGVIADDLGVQKLFSLVGKQYPSWTEEDCKHTGPCAEGVPINMDLGHGYEYERKKALEVFDNLKFSLGGVVVSEPTSGGGVNIPKKKGPRMKK